MQENNYNEIDLECNVIDDDDSFGSITVSDEKNSDDFVDMSDVRAPVKTGITIDLSDDDDYTGHRNFIKTISADIDTNGNIQINKNFNSLNDDIPEAKDYNEIDMETSISEDDDFIFESKSSEKEIIEEDDTFDDEYWKKLQKKYKKNTAGASIINKEPRFVGDPEEEMRFFNSQTKAAGPIPNINTAAIESSANSASDALGEDIEDTLDDYTIKLVELFDLIGFKLKRNGDGSFSAMDQIDSDHKEIKGNKLSNLIEKLMDPYIDDCIKLPLEIDTGEHFATLNEWLNWYSKDNNATKYPNSKYDIEYCDLIVNHLNECLI